MLFFSLANACEATSSHYLLNQDYYQFAVAFSLTAFFQYLQLPFGLITTSASTLSIAFIA